MSTQEQTLTVQQVANRFFELAQHGEFEQIHSELFSDDASSIEPQNAGGMQSVQGLDAIAKKQVSWNEMTEEIHGVRVTEPQVAGNFFTCTISLDVTLKGQERSRMDEVAVYEVRDGKIISEQFFY